MTAVHLALRVRLPVTTVSAVTALPFGVEPAAEGVAVPLGRGQGTDLLAVVHGDGGGIAAAVIQGHGVARGTHLAVTVLSAAVS